MAKILTTASKGVPDGLASLGAAGRVPDGQLPARLGAAELTAATESVADAVVSDAIAAEVTPAIAAAVGPKLNSADAAATYTTRAQAIDGIAAGLIPGGYHSPISNATTTMGLGEGLMRGGLLIVGRSCTLTEIGLEITVVGSAGSVIRLGLYLIPAGAATSAALLLEAGTIPGTAVGYAGIAISQAVNAGDKLLLMAASQGAAGTAPTVRGVTGAVPYFSHSTALTASQAAFVGMASTGITGALPATQALTSAGSPTVPKVLVKAT